MTYAVIFDMDGLLVESEPLWKEAERQVFSSVGVQVTDSLAEQTAAMTTRAVTEFWFSRNPWVGKSLDEVEDAVVDRVEVLVRERGYELDGVTSLLEFLKERGFKIGLSTNSPYQLIPVILNKLGIAHHFDAISSADDVEQGKPAPDVYLSTLKKLDVEARRCVAFEDSHSGIVAAKRANIKAVAVPHPDEYHNEKFTVADLKLKSLSDFNDEHLMQLLR